MPYPSRDRKKPDVFQAFEEGDKHAPVSARVHKARKRKEDRARKAGKEKNVGEEKEVPTSTKSAKKSKAKKKVDKFIVKLKLRQNKLEEKKKSAEKNV